MDKAHDAINASTHVIRGKSPDEFVKGAGRRADTEEKGYFNKNEYETRDATKKLVPHLQPIAKQQQKSTHRHMMLKMMMMER